MEVSTVVPKDMVYETLFQCSSLSELDKCKAVSKEWQDIIYDHGFIQDYYEREDNVNGYLMQEMLRCNHYHRFVSINKSDRNKFTFSRNIGSDLPRRFDDLEIKASSLQGILCCLMRYCGKDMFYVCKPTTGQWKQLPNPKFRYHGIDVGMAVLGSKPLHFVIIRLCERNSSKILPSCSNFTCERFDSKLWRWKQLEDVVLPFGSGLRGQAVYASGLICWHTRDDSIIAFSTDGKSRYVYQLPKIRYGFDIREIIEYQGKLGFIFQAYSELYVELWLLQDWKNDSSWEKMKCINLESSTMGDHARVWQFYSSEVALVKGVFNAMFYKLKDGTYEDVKLNINGRITEHFAFRSDFEPVDFKGAPPNQSS